MDLLIPIIGGGATVHLTIFLSTYTVNSHACPIPTNTIIYYLNEFMEQLLLYLVFFFVLFFFCEGRLIAVRNLFKITL